MNPWSSETPDREGAYWYAPKHGARVHFVDVYRDLDGELAAIFMGDEILLKDFQLGWWSLADLPEHPGKFMD